VIRRYRLSTAESQDVAQTVWLRLVEHLSSLREPRALPMWMITTAKRESLRYLSDRRRTLLHDPLDPSWQATSAEDAEPDAELLRAERHEALLAGLAELPARQRELLLLLVEDPPLSYVQISRRTGIPVGSIGPHPPPGPGAPPSDLCCQRPLDRLGEGASGVGWSRPPRPRHPRDLDRPRER